MKRNREKINLLSIQDVGELRSHLNPELETDRESLFPSSHYVKASLEIQKRINDMSEQFKAIFEEIRAMESIPSEVIEVDVIPTLIQAAEMPHIYHLLKEMKLKSEYTYRHSICVGAISAYIGKAMRLSEKNLAELILAATLHDIGKCMISEEILNKPGKLTTEEYEEMQRHTIYGYQLIKKIPGLPQSIALTALQHHEREDGRGYPKRLKGNNIHYYSKIVSIADIFHAMSSNRVYHKAMPFYDTLLQMNDAAFGKLNPEILFVFMNKLMHTLVGKEVELSNQQRGTIMMIHPCDPLYALVQSGEEVLDLRKHKELKIKHVYR